MYISIIFRKINWFLIALVSLSAAMSFSDPCCGMDSAVQSAIRKAGSANDVARAAAIMDTAVQKSPNDPDALAYFGLYATLLAGQTKDFMQAGQWANRAYQSLDKACKIDSSHIHARYYRGILGVNAPEFLGWQNQGIADLEYVQKRIAAGTDAMSDADRIGLYVNSATAYRKINDAAKLKTVLEKLVERVPDSETGKSARAELDRLNLPAAQGAIAQPVPVSSDTKEWMRKAKSLLNQRRIREALQAYQEAVKTDSTNLSLVLAIADTVRQVAGAGYGPFIYDDQEARTLLAFEMVKLFERAAALAPQNPRVRLMRGIIDVMMPFFVGKLEQGIEDLSWVSENAPSDSLKSEALFWLGHAYRQKGLAYWNTIAADHEKEHAFRDVLNAMTPVVRRVDADTVRKPAVVIEFVLGFQDFLAPQTAVWIEDAQGRYVKTVFVSGFSGFAKEKQVVLPDWAKQSKFEGLSAVTGASLDAGHYAFVWNCTDVSGKKVSQGKYTVRVETAYWPSMKYDMVSSALEIGKLPSKTAPTKGEFIPYFNARYIPK